MVMAAITTNLAELYISTNKLKGVVSLVQKNADNVVILSEELTDGRSAVLGLDSPRDAVYIEGEIEIDDTDTTGQVALATAKASKAAVASVAFYPNGKSTGAKKFSGSVYVVAIPNLGSTGNTSKTRKGSLKLVWSATPTEGVES